MAKKRFTDDLFGLFEDPEPFFPGDDQAPTSGADAGAVAENEEKVEVEVPVRTAGAKKKLSSKKFTADLDAFLTRDRERATAPAGAGNSSSGKRPVAPRRRRKSGLDLLIRSTVSKEEQAERTKKTAPDTKRVTLIFNKTHIATLKEQAKDRGMYLKDVVQEMVSDYLKSEN